LVPAAVEKYSMPKRDSQMGSPWTALLALFARGSLGCFEMQVGPAPAQQTAPKAAAPGSTINASGFEPPNGQFKKGL
jgi:hypothetical protein